MAEQREQLTTFEAARRKTIQRDNEKCVFCGLSREEHREESSTGKDLEVHHIIPQRKDGPDTPKNLLTVCHDCHTELETVTRKLFEWFAENEVESLKHAVTDDKKLDKYEQALEVSNAWGTLGQHREEINQLAEEHHYLRATVEQLPDLLEEHDITLPSNPLEETTETDELVSWLPLATDLFETRDPDPTTCYQQSPGDQLVDDASSLRSRSPGDPVRLRQGQSGWLINIGIESQAANIKSGEYVVVDLQETRHGPLLTLTRLSESPSNPEANPLVRKVMDRGDTLAVTIPPRHLGDRGLTLSQDEYTNSNPLLFEPLVKTGVVGLAPTTYYDGTTFSIPSHFDAGDANPGTPEDVGPIPPEAIQAAAQTTGVGSATVERALQLLADDLAADALADHRVSEYDAVETPEGTVYVVGSGVWEALDATSRLDASVRQAVRQAHVRAAELLLEDYMLESDARGFAASADAIVLDL